MMSDASLVRLARSRPVLFALFETLLSGGCALAWYALAALLYLENQSTEPWEPAYPPAGAFLLAAYVTALSLPLTWALRGLPCPPLRRLVDRVIQVRAGASVAVCVGAVAFAAVH